MNSEIKELRESAQQVISDSGIAADEKTTWSQIAELGWLMVSAPEELGGLDFGIAGVCALQLEMGRGLATVPYLPAMLAIEAVCNGEIDNRESWVERLSTAAEYIAAPLAAASSIKSVGGALRGFVEAVPSADLASHVLISTPEYVALVPLNASGVKVIARSAWDETRRLFDVQLDNVTLDKNLTLAAGGAAKLLDQRISTLRDFGLAADAVGGAAAILAMTVEYLQTRQQYGRPLALFQALKHRCADLKALVEATDALLHDNLGKIGDEFGAAEIADDAQSKGMAAKRFACAAFATIAEEALQLHGGIGMTEEHPCHFFLKRALLNDQLGLGNDRYEQGLADDLLRRFA
jgi:alkylation response protein AidB-like acyl-CoA dehydrogenase